MTPIYNPGSQDIVDGQLTLSVEVGITEPCTDSKSDEMVLNITTVGVNEMSTANSLNIFPNPTSDIFTLNIDGLSNGEEFIYLVYTSYGKEVYREIAQTKSKSYTKSIDMSNFVSGIYFVSIQTENGNSTMKVVKK
jgi:hypothetical protein